MAHFSDHGSDPALEKQEQQRSSEKKRRRAPWLLSVLMPFWVLQLPLQLAILGLSVFNAVYSAGPQVV